MVKKVSQKEVNQLLETLNERLGDLLPYKLGLMDPKTLVLARKNARFMKPETFKTLTENIRRDKNLSSIPFCFRDRDGKFIVLSGNHRVQAAIKAGIKQILILYSSDMTHDQQIGLQLSHNALEGEDDLKILKELWDSIESIDFKAYAGLDSELLEELDKIKFDGFSEERLDYKTVSFLFLPEEIERARDIFEQINGLFGKEDLYIFSLKQWQRFFDIMAEIKTSANIKNSATAFVYLLDMAETVLVETRPSGGGCPDDHSG